MNFLNIKKYCWACYAVLFVFLAVVCAQPAMAQTIKSEVVTGRKGPQRDFPANGSQVLLRRDRHQQQVNGQFVL